MSSRFYLYIVGLTCYAFFWTDVFHPVDLNLTGTALSSETASSSNRSVIIASEESELMTTPEDPLNDSGSVRIHYRQANMNNFLYQALRKGNMLCRDLAEQQNKKRHAIPDPPAAPVYYTLELDCANMFYQPAMGTGNVLLAFYGIRLAARVLGNIEVQIRCTDAEKTKSELLLPWMAGAFGTRASRTESMPLLNETCLSFLHAPVHYFMDDIRYELRRMAIALVGIPHPTHPAVDFKLEADRENELQVRMPVEPLIPYSELDDVTIHFRCGDIVEVRPHPDYGYSRFSFVANYISSDAKSIGIVTQPFQGQSRRVDGTEHLRCPILIGAFQQYLQAHFPRATVRVRNSPNETIALSYARFIMANQALAAGYSTFVYFPFMATFGTGYLQKPLHVEQSFEQHVNARFIEYQDMMSPVQLFELWNQTDGQEHILDWFTSEEL